MAIIYPHFLKSILTVHDKINSQIQYPFFDQACTRYEALRAYWLNGNTADNVCEKFGLTEYEFRKSLSSFQQHGTAGLIGLDSKQLTEELPIEVEREVFVLKNARRWIPATKMSLILMGFNQHVPVNLMRHLYASYGWAAGTKPYHDVDFLALNQKVIQLVKLQQSTSLSDRSSFFLGEDRLQTLLEVFRTLGNRGIIRRFPGSKFSFQQNKKSFCSLGLLGLVEKARPPFRNSKLGFKEEGRIILSKIQRPDKNEAHYVKILGYKNIIIDPTCLTKIFTRWMVKDFQSQFKGDLDRLLGQEPEDTCTEGLQELRKAPHRASPCQLDIGFVTYLEELDTRPVPLALPGIFLFLPYLDRLKIFEKVSQFMDVDPDTGYSWFSLLLLNLGRILGGISSISKSCRVNELSLPLMAGLVEIPCNDTLLNGLADISDDNLLLLRRYLTHVTQKSQLIAGKRVAFDFKMRDFTGDDVELKNIGKGPSPKRKICFPGFRPHIAWDLDTGTPISIEFRNGKARATTTVKRFIRELLHQSLGDQTIEHVYVDSEYTAEHVWNFIVDSDHGLGADLTMCIKKNKRVQKYIDSFLRTSPTWLFYDEEHTYTEQTFFIPIQNTERKLRCVLKRKESSGKLRCFGSTMDGLDSKGILKEYRARWIIENGIKDLTQNYFFDEIPGRDPRKINVHYFVVTLARILYEMFCQDYTAAYNADKTKKGIGTLRPEFIVGTNALLSRHGNELMIKWVDYYPEKQHGILQKLFEKLNEGSNDGLPFLGGLKIKFKIVPPKPKKMHNRLKRQVVEF